MNIININQEEPQQPQQSQAQGSSGSEESSSSGGGGASSDNSVYSEVQSSSSVDQQYESYADQRRAEQQQERIDEIFGFNKDEEQETFIEEEPSYEEVEAEKEAQEKEQAKADEKKAAEEEKAAKKEADKKAEDAQYESKKAVKDATEKAVDEAKSEAKHEVEKYKNERGYDDDVKVSAGEATKRMASSSLFDSRTLDVMKHFDETSSAADALVNNEKWTVSMDTDGDGTMEDVKLADAIADSFDSELDLYIQEEVNKVIEKYGHRNDQFLGQEAINELALKGIRVDSIGSSDEITGRVFSYSLIDVPDDVRELMGKDNLTSEEIKKIHDAVYADDAKVMEDKNGKKGSYIFADCLIPDGYAQGAEVNLSSILDQMGYDCISKADFIGHEDEYWEVINAVKEGVFNGEYSSSVGVKDIYGNTHEGRFGGTGGAPGAHGHGSHGDGGSSSSSSESTNADGKTELEKRREERAKAKEKELDKEIKAYRQKLLNEKVSEYKKENNDETPSRATMDEFEKEVDIKVRAKYGSKAA